MKRRTFVKRTIGTSLAATASAGILSAHPKQQAAKEYYELRVYTLKSGGKLKVFGDYLGNAMIPALNEMGIRNVGVFTEMGLPEPPRLYMLIPYQSIELFATAQQEMLRKQVYQQNSRPYMSATPGNPNFIRMHNYLMEAFDVIPRLRVPEQKERLFELRNYESFSEEAGRRKVEMFNEDEMDIFYDTGLDPVFFGKTIIGQDLPNLIYMLVFDDMEGRDRNWQKFLEHPEWKRISGLEKYADTVSQVKRTFLQPTEYSQI
jgi:hypothetical protein